MDCDGERKTEKSRFMQLRSYYWSKLIQFEEVSTETGFEGRDREKGCGGDGKEDNSRSVQQKSRRQERSRIRLDQRYHSKCKPGVFDLTQ